jgi:hypothetical protein
MGKGSKKELMLEATGAIAQTEFDPLKTPYEVDERQFPRIGTLDEQYRFLLRYAVLAPSSHNTQPWKFGITENGIAVYADYARRLPIADPGNRELLMGVGAAVMNLRVAAAHFGLGCHVSYNHSGGSEQPIVFLNLFPPLPDKSTDPMLASLFPSITRRHTNRNPFLVTRLPEFALERLRSIAANRQSSIFLCTDGTINQRIADLVAAAERIQQSDPTFRNESAEWVRPNQTQRHDGVPGAAFGIKGATSLLAPWAMKVFDLGRLRAAADRNLCAQAPGLMVIYSEDSVPHWLDTGELLESLLLTIIHDGLQYSFFNMLIEVPDLRTELRRLLGLSAWPQLLLRIGFCLTEPSPTPRRSIDEVVIQTDTLN